MNAQEKATLWEFAAVRASTSGDGPDCACIDCRAARVVDARKPWGLRFRPRHLHLGRLHLAVGRSSRRTGVSVGFPYAWASVRGWRVLAEVR